jgi:Gas vesicle synthesis protein GvpL/GvpF
MGNLQSSSGKYLYGITSNQHDDNNNNNNNSLETVPIQFSLGEIGINNRPVFSEQFRDIAAIVSKLSVQDIQQITGAIRSGQQKSMNYLISHQKVVQACRSAGLVVLPVRFGSIVSDKKLEELLRQQYNTYKLKMIRFRNKDEYGVRLLLGTETEQGLSKLLGEIPEIQIQTNEINSSSQTSRSGAAYFAKIRLNDIIRNKRFQIIENATLQIHKEIMGIAESSAASSKDTRDTIFHRAYLVDRSRSQDFKQMVEEAIGRNYHFNPLKFQVHISGPWAPYSFCMDSNLFSEATTTSSFSRSLRPASSSTTTRRTYRLVKKAGAGGRSI